MGMKRSPFKPTPIDPKSPPPPRLEYRDGFWMPKRIYDMDLKAGDEIVVNHIVPQKAFFVQFLKNPHVYAVAYSFRGEVWATYYEAVLSKV
jgi:hypothetical protein